MMFNSFKNKRDTLLKAFKLRYESLSQDERNELRQKVIEYEHSANQCDIEINENPWDYIFKYWNGGIIDSKVIELVDKLLFNKEELLIRKTRSCGLTTLLLTFVMWICENKTSVENKEIWYIGYKKTICSEYNNILQRLFRKADIELERCSKEVLKTNNGWTIRFFTINQHERMVGFKNPYMLFMDDVRFEHSMNEYYEFCDNFSRRNVNKETLVVEAYTDNNDEINRYAGYRSTYMNRANIQWFHDKNKIKNLEFRRYYRGVENTIKILDDDVLTVIGNDEYLFKMFDEGWRLDSDWLKNWDKMIELKRKLQNGEDDECAALDCGFSETMVNIIETTANSVEKICENINANINEELIEEITNLFGGCKSIFEVKKIERSVLLLINNRNNTDKKKKNTEEIKAYIDFLKDVFEI